MLEAAGPRPWIAVSWRAGVRAQMKRAPLDRIARTLRAVRGTIICVQRNPDRGELENFETELGRSIVDATATNGDLEAILALMSVVDEHVAVSNTNLHLRAAVGQTTRVLVPFPAEWRWRESIDGEMPWFRDHTAYRQTPDLGWETAFSELARDLAAADRLQ